MQDIVKAINQVVEKYHQKVNLEYNRIDYKAGKLQGYSEALLTILETFLSGRQAENMHRTLIKDKNWELYLLNGEFSLKYKY